MSHQPIEQLDVFALFEEIATWAWQAVQSWDHFAQRTIGEQLVRAIDSVNANLVEGDGRYTTNDSLRFFVISRGSAREARLWIERAERRKLVESGQSTAMLSKLDRAIRLLNLLIEYRRRAQKAGTVREERTVYGAEPLQGIAEGN